jgi:gag-polypeptide of LTR copia-type
MKYSNLWEIVTGKEGQPVSEGGKPPSDYAMGQWRMRQGQAFAIITLNVEDGQLVHLAGIEDDPVDAWRKLAEIHEPKSVANELHLLRRLMTLKMSPTQKMQEHIDEFQTCVDQLRAVGADQFFKRQLVMMFLLSLPSSYEHFITSIEC